MALEAQASSPKEIIVETEEEWHKVKGLCLVCSNYSCDWLFYRGNGDPREQALKNWQEAHLYHSRQPSIGCDSFTYRVTSCVDYLAGRKPKKVRRD